jgi:glycosidase
MKYSKLNVLTACLCMASSLAFAQDWPFNASDPEHGLRSRIEEDPSFQYTPSPDDWRDVNIYQIFTDRFADGDTGNNTIQPDWYVGNRPFPENRNFHHGGDWKGLKDNLDYLTGMGVKAIWMSGVQMNAQGKDTRFTPYHMYHPTDFFKVDPTMGTFQDLKDLIDACHARGIYVILDVVINHTADLNGLQNGNDDKSYWPSGGPNFGWWSSRRHAPPFDDLQYFHGNGTINNWDSFPEFIYGQFKGTDDLATGRQDVQDWLELAFKNLIDATDCDGFRVDAIKHVDFDWIMSWADSMRQHAAFRGKNDFIIFGEYFTYDNYTLAKYCKDPGYSFNSALFFPMSLTFKSVFVDGAGSGNLTQALNAKNQYGEGADRLVTFIDNHDVNRIGLQAGGNVGHINWIMPPALTFLYTATPVPCLFYGTEHAFQQGGHWNGQNAVPDYDDADWQRETMFDRGFQPGPAQGNKLAQTDAPLYQHIAALNRARDAHISLRRGSFQERWQSNGRGPYAFSRVYDQEEALVALNTSDSTIQINPQVGKSDGTEFVNALDPNERVTVSGGRLNFSLSGQQSKIFVAGLALPEAWIRGTHTFPATSEITPQTPIFINTEAGPTGTVAAVRAGFSADGGETWQVLSMTETNWNSQGGAWYSVRLGQYPANTEIRYYIEAEDTTGAKQWDNNNGENYALTVGPGASVWVRGTHNYPLDGDATELTELFVNTEAGPTNLVTDITLSHSTDGTNWTTIPMDPNPAWGSDGGAWYNANLGMFPADSTVEYYIDATHADGTVRDDNGGANFQVSIRSANNETLWIGNTAFSPENGSITSNSTIQITSETWPEGVATNVAAAYTINGGASWTLAPLSLVTATNNNDHWSMSLGPYPDGTTLRFALVAQSATQEQWDNNGGSDYIAQVGDTTAARMASHAPVIGDEAFDFDQSGGALGTSGTAGFGDFGAVYVNYDESNLYIGATGVDLPDDSDNNAYIIFVSGGVNAGSDNLWNFDGAPAGLDQLHNAAFSPAIHAAILLGDVFGDGNFSEFNMYKDDGFPFGQGIFATPSGGDAFAPVPGSSLNQYAGYGPDDRIAAIWECAIPLSFFGVASAQELDNLHLAGLMVTGGTTNNNRFISGKYLGDNAELGNEEEPDEFGNFAYSFVNLSGTHVRPPQAASDMLGVPVAWISEQLGDGYALTPSSNKDGSFLLDREEYFAGTNPNEDDALDIEGFGYDRLHMYKHGGQNVQYIIETADALHPDTRQWNWTERHTVARTDGILDELPDFLMNSESMLMRVKVRIPPPDGTSERVSVGASPSGASFSAPLIQVLLSVSGVNVISSTYTVEGDAPVAYTNGQTLVFGDGMDVGDSRTLTLDGETAGGVTNRQVFTFTKVPAHQQITWTGAVRTDPAAGSWDEGEDITVHFETSPINAAENAGIVYSADGGSSWQNGALVKGAPNASNDTWSINLGSFAEGVTLQYALVAYDSHVNPTWNNNNNNNHSVSVNSDFVPGGNQPYSTNPTKGQYRAQGMVIDGSNTGGEWTSDMLIALDMANDDPRSLGSNWTLHEAPIDFTHLWASWDDDNVYIAWQMVDVTDVVDPANAGSGDPINRNDGILIWAVIDTGPGGSSDDMWAKSNTWSGVNVPDFQIYMAGSLWQSYMSRAEDGSFPVDDGGINYNTTTAWGMEIEKSAALIANEVWGVDDVDKRGNPGDLFNFRTSGHARTDRDSFYEMKIPMTALGITRAELETEGIAVMLGAGGQSSMDSIPHDETTLDTDGVEVWNSSREWADSDTFTAPFARIGN